MAAPPFPMSIIFPPLQDGGLREAQKGGAIIRNGY